MSHRFVLSVALPMALLSSSAFANDNKAACLDAAANAQSLRDAHKLVETRAELLVCAAEGCPAAVQADCVKWLAEVEQGLPSLVITAKDDAGRPLFEVKLSLDGQPLASKLQGAALPVNPGFHALHLETPDGLSVDQRVLVKEGVKNQDVTVTLGKGKPGAATAASATPTTLPVTQAVEKPTHPWRVLGWMSGGIGVAGMAVGTVFGVQAISDKTAADCSASGTQCKSGPLGDAKSAATASTIGIVAGGVLLAGGLGLVLFSGHWETTPAPRTSVRVVPLAGAHEGGMLLGGSF